MKSLRDLWRESASELAGWCHTSTTRDFKTLTSRIEDEGTSFLTITLPNYGKAFESALERGYVDTTGFTAFRSERGGLPTFLSGFLCQVFDEESGYLLPEPSIDSIFAIRFLTSLFAKIELPCSHSREYRAMQGYVECEKELDEWESTAHPTLFEEFRRVSRVLFADVFTAVDSDIYSGNIQPKHGPGSTADGLMGNQKFRQLEWTQRLEEIFPYGEYCLPNWRHWRLLDHVKFLEPGMERPVKVISVPKTLKTPRIIAMEPTCMQFMQQAVSQRLVSELESPHWPLQGTVGFSDQLPNREMARRASRTGHLATLDLSEASDRVSNRLVTELFADHPWLHQAVQATRSSRAEVSALGLCLPKLSKFASMGSALCFPVEAMVFLTIAVIGWSKSTGIRATRENIKSELLGNVRVYGDDIIVPTDCALSVISALEAYGFKINGGKSFWKGKFRESCGGDYFDGEDVTPIRLKKPFPKSRQDAREAKSLVEFRNHLYLRGMWKTASYLDERIERLLVQYPIVEATSPCLGRLSFLPYLPGKFDRNTHSPRVRGWVLQPVFRENLVENEYALLKCLSSPLMAEDVRHLERSGRPVCVTLNKRWVSPF
jgi:hypothetical protein